MSNPGLARREFLRLAAGGAALFATGQGCVSSEPGATGAATAVGPKGRPILRIGKRTNYISGYDEWWDEEFAFRWGERNGIEVLVEHFDVNQLQAQAQAEVAAQRGHDLFQVVVSAAQFEDDVIDHRDVVEEAEEGLGKLLPFIERTIRNPRTGKYFAFSDAWNPSPVHYRTDLWDGIGHDPGTWEDLITAGKRLKAAGHPIGIGMSPDVESNATLLGLMFGFGASIQDEEARVALNSRATVEAVKVGAALFRSAMTDEVLGWDIASNNRYLVSGRGSLIVNSIAALRAIEAQDAGLAAKTGLRPLPEGPAGRRAPYAVNAFVIWKFAENQEAARRFLVDAARESRAAFLASRYLQIPSFPEAVGALADLMQSDDRAEPPGKYALLARAAEWTTNLGFPGHTHIAIQEVVEASVISEMFAAVARGEMTAEDSVRAAEAKIRPIFDRWREQGKI